jgi:hypothetical protein
MNSAGTFFLFLFIFFDATSSFFLHFFGGMECVGHPYAYVAHFVFLRDVWIRTQTAAIASRRTTTVTKPPNHI